MVQLSLGLALWCASPALAVEAVVTQSAAPTTTNGTQDFTSSGFGTPKCSIYWGGYGITANTQANHSGLWIGMADGTRQASIGGAAEDGQATTDTGNITDTTSAMLTMEAAGQTKDGEGNASFITDGSRLTWADAPPAAYLVNAINFGGSGVSNCYVGTSTTTATLDADDVVTAPGFTPDLVIILSAHNTTSNFRQSIGIAWKNGASVVQRTLAFNTNDGVAAGSPSGRLATTRVLHGAFSGAASGEFMSFDTNGFTIRTRDVGGARDYVYLALKLNGLSAWLGTVPSPTATGNNAITTPGFKPQFALMLQGCFPAVDTDYSDGNAENASVSACDATGCASAAVWSDDGAATSDEISISDTKWSRVRKNTADFSTCTMASFDTNGYTENCTVVDATARQRAVLLIQESAGGGGGINMMRRRVMP